MKKLYRKGQVHPSPSPSPSSEQISLSYLPAAILTLAATLSSEDKEVLAYLLSCSSSSSFNNNNNNTSNNNNTTPFDFDPSKSSKKHPQNLKNINQEQNHLPSFSCYCFTCYTTYWARWDSSPNRQLIHEIIDAFEDNLLSQRKKKQGLSRREKRKNKNNIKESFDNVNDANIKLSQNDYCKNNDDGTDGSVRVNPDSGRVDSAEEVDGQLCHETGEKQGSVRKIVSFIGERIWGGFWG